MRRNIVAVLLVLVVPFLAFGLLAGTFSNAVIRDLRIAVVDQDRSPMSETFVQAISAAPGVTVSLRPDDLTEAMHAIRSGAAIAAVYIPRGLERDVAAGRRPQIVNFFNKQFFTPGNIASSAVQGALATAVAEIPHSPDGAAGYTPGALVLESYVLSNPALNYVQFLLRAIMPTVLHVLIAIAGAFAAGSEFGPKRDVVEWLATAGGSPLVALIGKLLPYVAIFLLIMAAGLGIIHGVFMVPFRGDSLILGASAILMIIAYLSLGAMFVLLVKGLAVGLTLTGVICSPAFGFAGVGFPTLAMNGFAQAWGSALPLRWYIQVLFDQAARGVPARDSLEPFLILAGLAALYFLIAWLASRRIFSHPPPRPTPTPIEKKAGGVGIAKAFLAEYGRVLGDKGAFGLIVIGPLIYAALYPQPYVGQLIRDIPIAVVDDDGSEVSRSIVQALNAHEATKVALRATDLAAAKAALDRREVFGILSIPAGTEREILKGHPGRLPAYVDSAYFLLYNRTLQGISESTAAVSADLAARTARPDGSLDRAALSKNSPVEILSQPLFNPTGGYGDYVVPAAFLLILQQTLLMGVATLGGVASELGGAEARRQRGLPAAVLGQALAHLCLSLPSFALYLVVMPNIYGYAWTTRVLDLLVLAIPYILAVSFLAQFLGALARRRETAVIILIGFGLPLFFLVGLAWPPEAIPPILKSISSAIPSTSGIDALLRVNQTGASLADVGSDWLRLWVLTAVYALLACLVPWLISLQEPKHAT